ncbi:unnamed protein product [Linum trigynum]|uniref:DUF4283 domain-containing protein n=1 Tax=Linum trigynum TaxID=586398 RepID=A0AAV2F7G0_9ROSI
MAAPPPSNGPSPTGKPPEHSGNRRTATATSSPDGKSEKEAVQPKKRARSLNLDKQGVGLEGDAIEMETETAFEETETTNRAKHTWQGAAAKLFQQNSGDDEWYVEESDSGDVVSGEKEEDEISGEEEQDPLCPTAPFSASQKIRWRTEWRSALVVRGLGRRVSYIPLEKRLNFLWARHGNIQISDMKNGCFLVRFKSKQDYELAAYGGPWMLGDIYLAVHRWYKGFNPWTSEVKSTMVWVQLPDLPVEFINAEAVMLIGGMIGRPVRVDRATDLGARAKYARVCVEIDLTRPLLSQYKVEGIKYLIQYEGLENICGNCGKYGVASQECKCKSQEDENKEEEVEMVPETQEIDPTEGKTYGEWMTAKRREWRLPSRVQRRADEGRNYIPNRFSVLQENETEGRPGSQELEHLVSAQKGQGKSDAKGKTSGGNKITANSKEPSEVNGKKKGPNRKGDKDDVVEVNARHGHARELEVEEQPKKFAGESVPQKSKEQGNSGKQGNDHESKRMEKELQGKQNGVKAAENKTKEKLNQVSKLATHIKSPVKGSGNRSPLGHK